MPIASRFMTASKLKIIAAFACALLVAGSPGFAAAQDRIPVDDLKARAEAGDRTAALQLAVSYYLGTRGVDQDFKEAARWYLKLAQQGDALAQTAIGLMYARGYGVGKDLEAALKWWTLAAVQNDPGAQFNLGLLYSQGEGVRQDYTRAVEWYLKAASRGHVQAQHNLGMHYREGLGTAKDPVRAYFWVSVAALQGDELAQASLQQMGRGMTPGQISQAQAQAQGWLKKAKKVLR